MKIYGETDIGLVRDENQDGFSICDLALGQAKLAVVCDGMGGAAGGQIASRIALDAFVQRIENGFGELFAEGTPSADAVHSLYSHAVYYANQEVFDRAVISPEYHGMGTTVSAALIADGQLFTANIGDSRIYLCRAGELTRLTRDDTYVQQLVDAGELTPQEALTSPKRHIITRALGTQPYVDFHFSVTALQTGDRLLLCSDGLTDCCSDAVLCEILSLLPGSRAAVGAMIEAARREGGPDNITAVVIDTE